MRHHAIIKRGRAPPGYEFMKTTVPDLDNLTKHFMDALQEIVFPNDKSIATLTSSKVYAPQNKIVCNLTWKPDPFLS